MGLINYARAAATTHMIIHVRLSGRKMMKKRQIGYSVPDGLAPPDVR